MIELHLVYFDTKQEDYRVRVSSSSVSHPGRGLRVWSQVREGFMLFNSANHWSWPRILAIDAILFRCQMLEDSMNSQRRNLWALPLARDLTWGLRLTVIFPLRRLQPVFLVLQGAEEHPRNQHLGVLHLVQLSWEQCSEVLLGNVSLLSTKQNFI